MPVNRILFSKPLSEKSAPPWICPTCKVGHLKLVLETFHYSETASTIHDKIYCSDAFDWDWVSYKFTCLLKCANHDCQEVATVAGKGELEQYFDDENQEMDYIRQFFPLFISPSPLLINIPQNCPRNISEEICKAFISSWADYPATGNRIRTSIELLLDSIRVKKICITKNKKREKINLHNRIESIQGKYSEIKEHLLAIKWLGNAGSHESTIDRNDIFDALDILEIVLDHLYEHNPKRVKKLVRDINTRKGPKPKKKSL